MWDRILCNEKYIPSCRHLLHLRQFVLRDNEMSKATNIHRFTFNIHRFLYILTIQHVNIEKYVNFGGISKTRNTIWRSSTAFGKDYEAGDVNYRSNSDRCKYLYLYQYWLKIGTATWHHQWPLQVSRHGSFNLFRCNGLWIDSHTAECMHSSIIGVWFNRHHCNY